MYVLRDRFAIPHMSFKMLPKLKRVLVKTKKISKKKEHFETIHIRIVAKSLKNYGLSMRETKRKL